MQPLIQPLTEAKVVLLKVVKVVKVVVVFESECKNTR